MKSLGNSTVYLGTLFTLLALLQVSTGWEPQLESAFTAELGAGSISGKYKVLVVCYFKPTYCQYHVALQHDLRQDPIT